MGTLSYLCNNSLSLKQSLFKKHKIVAILLTDIVVNLMFSFSLKQAAAKVCSLLSQLSAQGSHEMALSKMCPDKFEPFQTILCDFNLFSIALTNSFLGGAFKRLDRIFRFKKLHQQKMYLQVPVEILSAGDATSNVLVGQWDLSHFLLGDSYHCLREAGAI